ncbi:MAG: acetate--CoA ligase family protein [Pseudomonadota bacterium]
MSALTGLAQALMAPDSIALIGASGVIGKHTSLPQRFLRSHGYAGPIYPVNPGRAEIFGEKAFVSACAIGQPVDHALIMVPTAGVEAAVADCAAAGVRCATILANGFAEAGAAGLARQQHLLALAGGMRLLGPNSLGIINPLDGVALSANEVLSIPTLTRGSNALISQSGSMLGALLSRGSSRGIGFSRMLSVGSEADISLAEIGNMLIDDEHTETILLFIETIRDADAFAAMARRAYAAGKPVVAFRLGRSDIGAELGASHTGAMIGNGAAVDSFLRDLGVVRVQLIDTLLDMGPLLAGRRPPSGKRVSVMTTTGGGGALVVDSLCERGAAIAAPDAALIEKLAGDGIAISDSPLIDLTLAGANAATYGAVLRALMDSAHCDMVVAVVGSSAQFRPDRAIEPIAAACATPPGKPTMAFIVPEAEASYTLLKEARIPVFRTPEACADAAAAYLDWRAPRTAPPASAPAAAAEALARLPGEALNAAQSRSVFAALGIPQAGEMLLDADPAGWDDASLGRLGFPVVAKILSRDILHKTEAGGIALGLGSADALRSAGRLILERVAQHFPQARIDGIQVETMEQGLAEVMLGYRHDPGVGPTITVATGGVMAELFRDFSIRTAPVGVDTAHEMIAEVKSLAIVRGYRGLPRGDVDALARAIVALSALACLPGQPIADAEINPVLVKGEGKGIAAVDGLIVRRPCNQNDEEETTA